MVAYRIFFPLAALEAIIVVGLWPALLARGASPSGMSWLGEWHARELLYGYVSAVLAGFALTALPRWIGKPLVPQPPIRSLAALWLAGRLASFPTVASGIVGTAWIVPLFPIVLAVLVARYILGARNRRNEKVAILLGLFALGAAVEAMQMSGGQKASLGGRIGIASTLGLVMVFGGRIIPSVSAAVLAIHGKCLQVSSCDLIEACAAVLATAALGGWVAAPDAPATVGLCAAAAFAQSLRLGQWHGLSVIGSANAFVFHVAYACLPLGFALIALGRLRLITIPAEAGMHAWTVGSIGMMTVAVMTSMVRRQAGRPFERSSAASAAYVLAGLATVCRVSAGVGAIGADIHLLAAGLFWVAAFCAFLLFLGD